VVVAVDARLHGWLRQKSEEDRRGVRTNRRMNDALHYFDGFRWYLSPRSESLNRCRVSNRIRLVPKVRHWSCVTLLASLFPLIAQERFQGITPGYLPEGRPLRRASIVTQEQCEAVCTEDSRCKAFAFRTTKPACYFYTRVFMGGGKLARSAGIYSAGLSIVPKHGFVSAFKSSSFPPRPTFTPAN
jgi:hypothetical protein